MRPRQAYVVGMGHRPAGRWPAAAPPEVPRRGEHGGGDREADEEATDRQGDEPAAGERRVRLTGGERLCVLDECQGWLARCVGGHGVPAWTGARCGAYQRAIDGRYSLLSTAPLYARLSTSGRWTVPRVPARFFGGRGVVQ
jgi:hypothetical protein